jgi:hypothetical protein
LRNTNAREISVNQAVHCALHLQLPVFQRQNSTLFGCATRDAGSSAVIRPDPGLK